MSDPNESNSSEKSEYDCHQCGEFIRPPIFQCYNGDLFCGLCIDTLRVCPTCTDALPEKKIRNLMVEQIVREMKLPCPFSKNGCTKAFTLTDGFEEHKAQCPFRPLKYCSLLGLKCNAEVTTGELFTHYTLERHGSGFESRNGTELKMNNDSFKYNIEDGERGKRKGITLIKTLGQIFILKCMHDVNENSISWTVSIVGSDKLSFLFGASIKIRPPADVNDSTKLTLLKWKGPITNINFNGLNALKVPDLFCVSYKHFPKIFQYDEDNRELKWNIELTIYDVQKANKANSLTTGPLIFHPGVFCNGCKDETLLIGPRHKCIECVNYNLCGNCLRKKIHADHLFVTIPHPNMAHQLQQARGLR